VHYLEGNYRMQNIAGTDKNVNAEGMDAVESIEASGLGESGKDAELRTTPLFSTKQLP
jgi:hypothetical protein